MKQVEAIHSHGGKTEIVVDWEAPKSVAEPEAEEKGDEKKKKGDEKKLTARKAGGKKEKP
jgi:hypothetical protein